MLRHPRTTAEMRAVEAARLSGVQVRGKRSRRALPTAYSDINPASDYDRSWKRHRKGRKAWDR